MKRRFEFVEGASSKFWQVEVAGADVTVTYGRIGTDGQARIKTHASPAVAEKEAAKLIDQKTGKGYVEVAGAAAQKAATKKTATKKAAPAATATPTKKAATKKAAKKAVPKKKGPAVRPVDRWPTAVALADGRTLVISSEDDVNKRKEYDANAAFVFDPEEVAFSLVAETPFKMYLNARGVGCTAAGEAVFVQVDEKNRVACFDPVTGTWRAGKPLEALHSYAAAALLADGRVVVAGGETYYPHSNDEVHLYDPAKDAWSKVGKLSAKRAHPAALRLPDGAVLFVGGEAMEKGGDYPTESATCDRFDPKTKKCTAIAKLPKPMSQPSALLLADGRVAVAGQDELCAFYDVAKDEWSKAIEDERICKPFVQLADGTLAFFTRQRVTLLDPATGKLSSGGETLLPRNMNTVAIRLPDDRVLLVGGDLYNNIACEPELWDPKTKTGTPLAGLEGKITAQLRRLAKYREKHG